MSSTRQSTHDIATQHEISKTPVVFVVDDDISIRESLEMLLENAGWNAVLFSSSRDFLAHPRTLSPGCLILDVGLPDLNGLELQQRLDVERATMPIIFITGRGDIPTSVRAMKAGAAEFLTKPFGDDVLLSAIESAIERSRAALGQEQELQLLRERHASLSIREREVMALVAVGMLNKQVGAELGISEITVKAHRGKVMRKMSARSLPDLVTMTARLR
jgi:FixJ family two-component response regulator